MRRGPGNSRTTQPRPFSFDIQLCALPGMPSWMKRSSWRFSTVVSPEERTVVPPVARATLRASRSQTSSSSMQGSSELVSSTVNRTRRVVTGGNRSEFLRALTAGRIGVGPDGDPGRASGSIRESSDSKRALRRLHRRMSSRRASDSGSFNSRSPYSTPAKNACMPK